ncbi:UNVERIFIED_CONTAM: hypothetical protein FKN15_063514 [Acipenser sinensis]
MTPGLFYTSPLFLLASEVTSARNHILRSVQQARGHWRRLFHGEHLASDKLKLSKRTFTELEELLDAVQSRSVGDIDAQLSFKVVFREPLLAQPQTSNSPLPQLVFTYHHLESVINTACFNLWTGLL